MFLYGVDTLLNDNGERVLSEVNTLNVGGISVLEEMTGEPLTQRVVEHVMKLHQGPEISGSKYSLGLEV